MAASRSPVAAPSAAGVWRRNVREGLQALTTRGRAFIAGGTTAAVCGVVLGERDLVRLGILVALVPLVTVALVSRTGQRLSLSRTLSSTQVEVNQQATVQLELVNVGARTGLLLAEEQIPWALGQRPRFVVGWIATGSKRRVSYPVQADVRGIYEIGPLQVRVADPFGMLALRRLFTRTTPLVVVPAIEALPPIAPLGAWTGSGDNRPRPFSTGSAADVTVREYRRGDDLRRVHWRSTARTGELMVRREEQPWQSRCTLFIDNRASSHRGSGPDSSLERAVSVTASIAHHLGALGFEIRLVSADGAKLDHRWHDGDTSSQDRPILEHLAALPTTAVERLSTDWVDDGTDTGLFLGVLGDLDDRDRRVLARLHGRGRSAYAVSVAVADWSGRHRDTELATSTDFFRGHGWKAADLGRSDSLPAVWKELGR